MAPMLLRPLGRRARTLRRHLPPRGLAMRPMRRVGGFIDERFSRNSGRRQSHSTNPPQLAVMVEEIMGAAEGAEPP